MGEAVATVSVEPAAAAAAAAAAAERRRWLTGRPTRAFSLQYGKKFFFFS
jgi:hypothetical protein